MDRIDPGTPGLMTRNAIFLACAVFSTACLAFIAWQFVPQRAPAQFSGEPTLAEINDRFCAHVEREVAAGRMTVEPGSIADRDCPNIAH